MIADNVQAIRQRIREAALRGGCGADEIRIVAAAKGQPLEKIRDAVAAGIRIIGHNYVQEAEGQASSGEAPEVETHMIGHLQRNKAGRAVELFDVIETIDNPRIASALDSRTETADRTIGVMIQVNLSGEVQKSGIEEAEVEGLAEHIRGLSSLKLLGLMTMPPFFDDPDRARPYFARLRELREKLITCGALSDEMKELSMGMTGDFEVAIEEGATLVRIGTALFGPRS